MPASFGERGTVNEITSIAMGQHAERDDADLHQALLQFVGGRLRHHADGEDIVQETWLRLYDYRQKRSVANVGAFCFKVARNLVHDYFRARRAMPEAQEVTEEIACPQPRIETVLDYRQRVEILVGALRVMPPLRREVFLRRRLDGIASQTIAEDLGLSVAAIEKHCTRALADLRAALEKRGLPGSPAMSKSAIMQRAEATLNDPALGEALAQAAAFGRLSNEDIRAMRETRRRKLAAGVTAALALAVGVGVWQQGGIMPETPRPSITKHSAGRSSASIWPMVRPCNSMARPASTSRWARTSAMPCCKRARPISTSPISRRAPSPSRREDRARRCWAPPSTSIWRIAR
jgi:RNA polymerase sigma-70 factor (ECF subfamily)